MSESNRMAELDRLIAAGQIQVDREAFFARHPFVLSDGRRFGSLELTADTVRQMPYGSYAVHEPSGLVYDWADCARIATRDRRSAAVA